MRNIHLHDKYISVWLLSMFYIQKMHQNSYWNALVAEVWMLRINFGIISITGLEIATDTVANATNIFSLATKNSGLVAKVATRF